MKEGYKKIFEQIIESSDGSYTAVERLTRENERLKRQLIERDKIISTLREARSFYQENYRKAKAAYEKLRGLK